MSDDFHEIRLHEKFSQGSEGGHGWSTQVVSLSGGAEERNIEWDQDRGEWNLEFAIKTRADASTLRAFKSARRGRGYGFRFKWWPDYTAEHVTGDASRTVVQVASASSGAIQLVKTYADLLEGTAQGGAAGSITLQASHPEHALHAVDDAYNGKIVRIISGTGSGQIRAGVDYTGSTRVLTIAPNWATAPDATSRYRIELFTYPKNIVKPVPGTGLVYVNDALDGGASIDYTTGLITGVTRAVGDIVTASFEWDVPVRFMTDRIREAFHSPRARDFRDYSVTEIQEL